MGVKRMGRLKFMTNNQTQPSLTLYNELARMCGVNTVDASFIQSLQALLSPERVLTSAEDVIPYGFDGTAVLKQRPGAVVFPLTAEEVADCVRLARQRSVPVVTRGSGTGLSGGSVPLAGCLVICLVKMDKLIEVDEKNLTLRAQSGVITKEMAPTTSPIGAKTGRACSPTPAKTGPSAMPAVPPALKMLAHRPRWCSGL